MKPIAKMIAGIVSIIIGVIEVFVLLRIILKLFNANDTTPFVSWIYDITQPFIAPFAGIFPDVTISSGFVLELTAVFALVIYELARFLLARAINWIGETGEEKEIHDERRERHDRELRDRKRAGRDRERHA